jgi:hypothetical protein
MIAPRPPREEAARGARLTRFPAEIYTIKGGFNSATVEFA